MKPAPFDYVRPTTVQEACRVLADAGGGATVIAGGQTLMPLLNLRMSQPFVLVDVNGIEALRGISRDAAGIRLGPSVRQADALRDPLLARHLPVLVTALSNVGHHQTRNRGTVGGSIAFGEPAAEMPATAVALGARIELASVRGTRSLPAAEFYIGPYMTAIEPDELVTAIVYPDWPDATIQIFREVVRRPGDFALVGMVGAAVPDRDTIVRAGLAWFGMGPTPVRMKRAEAMLSGRRIADIDIAELAGVAVGEAAPFDDHHASAEYRRTVGRRIFTRTLSDAIPLKEAA